MFFDPVYLIFMIPGLLLSLWATAKTRGAFDRYSRVRVSSGMTGAQAAASRRATTCRQTTGSRLR